MSWTRSLLLAMAIFALADSAHAFEQGIRRLSDPARKEEAGGRKPEELDCYVMAGGTNADGWRTGGVFIPIGRPCEIDRFAIVAGYDGGMRSVYGDRDDCRYLRARDSETTCAQFYEDHINAVLENLQGYVARTRKEDPDAEIKILIYAHGGMVSHQGAVRGAERTASWMIKDGFFPIFLIWNSDFSSAYTSYLCCVADGESFAAGKPYFFAARALGDLTAGLGRAPENFGDQQVRSLRTFARGRDSEFFLCSAPQGGCPYRQTVGGPDTDNVVYPPFDTADDLNDRGRITLKRRIVYPLFYPVRAVATVGSDLGARGWDNMVRRTRIAFTGVRPEAGTEVSAPPNDPSTWARCPEASARPELYGPFGQFFARLRRKLGADDMRNVRITFVGHSMGALVGDELARLYPCLPYERFVYMAGASTIREVEATVFPIMQRHQDVRFNNLMLHPLAESRELFRGGLAPQGSLLEWIDSMFEGPRSADERTVGKWRNMVQAMPSIPAEIVARTSFRIFPTQTKLNMAECDLTLTNTPEARKTAPDVTDAQFERCHPVVHGGFDDYSFWRARYWEGPQPTGR